MTNEALLGFAICSVNVTNVTMLNLAEALQDLPAALPAPLWLQ